MRGTAAVRLLWPLAVLALCVPAAQARPRRRAATPAGPSFSVRMLTVDQVTVLQRGSLLVRLTARGASSAQVSAVARQGRRIVAVARSRTLRLSPRRVTTRVLTLPITPAGRLELSTCYATDLTLVVRGRGPAVRRRARGRGRRGRVRSSQREQRFRFVCRGGSLTPAHPSGGGHPGTPAGQLPGARSASYEVGLDVQPINPCPTDGTWRSAAQPCGGAPVYLGGFGFGGGPAGVGPAQTTVPGEANRAATGILTSTDPALRDADGAHARAIAFSDGQHPLLIADMEVQGWFTAYKTAGIGIIDMRKKVAHDLAGVDAQHVFIQSDHSHGGADALGVWGGVPTSFLQYMAGQTVTALERAYVNRRPGRLFYGSADGIDLLSNQFSRDPANQSMDSNVRVLQARDERGRPFATLLNFSAHGTMLGESNTRLTGDWPQAANAVMERRFGGRAITVVGTLGRTQPARDRAQAACPAGGDGTPAIAFCRIERYGEQVVDRAAQALSHATEIAGPPRVDARSYLITDPTSNALILGGDAVGGPLGIPLQRSLSPPWLNGNVLGTVTGTARIGDVLLSSVPGEIYPQVALKVADTVTGIRHGGHEQDGFMTAGLSNDQLGYLIAPFEAYPQPIERSLFSDALSADVIGGCAQAPSAASCPTPDPVGNDNYLFNVSHTMGERVTCSLLRGADDLLRPTGPGFRASYERCALFPNDAALAPGSDVTLSEPPGGSG